MRAKIAILLLLPFLTFGQTTCRIPRGTLITFELSHDIDPSIAHPGDDVPLQPIPQQRICAAAMPAHATVARITRTKCGDRHISLRLKQIEFSDHSHAPVTIAPTSATAALLEADKQTLTHPGKALTTNLGPIPLLLLGLTPLVAAEDAARSVFQPCPKTAKDLTLKAGTKIHVVLTTNHTIL